MTTHRLREHSEYPAELPEEVASTLSRRYPKQVDVRHGGSPGQWTLATGSYVGTIRVADHEFLIRPKVPLENLLALMDVEVSSETWRREVVGLAQDNDLLAVMARLFCIACENTTRRGIRRSYLSRQERLVSPRGRIDVASIVRSPGTLSPLPCVFDEHTANNQLNQLLRAAINRARRVPALGAAWQRRLLMQLSAFEEVEDTQAIDWSWVDRWEPSPMERHYSTSVRLAHMLLKGSSLKSEFGGAEANTFLLNMNSLFEAWVGRQLKYYCKQYEIAEQYDRVDLDHEGHINLRPDFVAMTSDQRVVAVADAKYKLLPPTAGARNPDYYQALAYATAFSLDEVWLIYARYPDNSDSKDVLVRNAGVSLRTFGIDLSGPIEESIAGVREFADRMLLGSKSLLVGR